jgi:hypothetical protein
MKTATIKVLIILILFFMTSFSYASDVDLEKVFQRSLVSERTVVKKVREKHKKGEKADKETAHLKAIAKDIKTAHVQILEKFRAREEELKSLGPKAQQRHREMMEAYEKAIDEYLSLAETLPDGDDSPENTIDKMRDLLDSVLYDKKTPIFGSLPYRSLKYPATEPTTGALIIAAYKGGNRDVRPEDTADTEEAPISREISTLAQSLKWNPVLIYEYVKNDIETEWYWGCMKGAEETLRQKSGNGCDQATLLTALLRASGFPSRYVRGTMEFFAGRNKPIEKIENLTGIEDPWKIAEFFQKAGIPFKPIISGGGISNFQIEHIWVESLIPYSNYRGNVLDDNGKRWLGLDTSIKVKGYDYNDPLDVFGQPQVVDQLLELRDEYLGAAQSLMPLEHLEERLKEITGSELYVDDYKLVRSLIPEVLNILPASMQFHQRAITNEYTEIPGELKHKVRFTASDMSGRELFTLTLDTLLVSNRSVALTYEPETVEDQEIIDYYGGLDNTPAYLIRLRPVLTADGERKVVGADGLPMGADYNLTMEFISPRGTESVRSTHIIGNLSAIGIVARRAVEITPSNFPLPQEGETSVTSPSEGGGEKNAEDILFKETINYIDRWNQAEDELASLLHLAITRPIPTVTTIGGVIDVSYLLNIPHGFEWKGEFIDAGLRAIEITPSHSPLTQGGEDEQRKKAFMRLSALEGSVLEHRIFEDDWQVDSISTAKLFQTVGAYCDTPSLPGPCSITTIDKANIDSVLSSVDLDDAIKNDIRNAVNQNIEVRIPQTDGLTLTRLSYKDWRGIGYIKEDTDTGEVGYMLSGMIAGGMTAVSPAKWKSQKLADILGKPYTPSTSSSTSIAGYIAFPYEGSALSVSSVDVEGAVSDPSADVRVNGIKAEVFSSGRFIAYGVKLNEGANLITMTARPVYGGSTMHSISVTYNPPDTPPISVTITYPLKGAALHKPSTLVKGTLTSDAGEVWIKVNGMLAEVYRGEFTANGVTLTEGDNTIIVHVMDSNGSVGRAETKVTAETTSNYVTLNANITSGIPKLTTYFSVNAAISNPISSYQMDFEGDGTTDYTGTTFEGISHAYTSEGIYYPTITVTDDQGNAYTDTMAITILNKAAIDALLKSMWEGMKTELINQDVEGALAYFMEESRDLYGELFTALFDELQDIAQTMQPIDLIYLRNNTAKYRILLDEFYGGEMVSMTYYIYFVIDRDGVWKIYRY